MKQDGTESFESPLDEVLEDMPQEEPPEDLEQRCLEALGGGAAERTPSQPRWYAPLRNVIAVAAALVLVAGVWQFVAPQAKVPETRSERVAEAPAHVPGEPPGEMAPATRQREMAHQPPRTEMVEGPPPAEMADEMALGQPPAPESPMRRMVAPEDRAGARVEGATYGQEQRAPPMVAGDRVVMDEAEYADHGQPVTTLAAQEPPEGEEGEVVAPGAGPVAGVTSIDGVMGQPSSRRPMEPEVEDPWRDLSGRRQVITTKEMEVEVRDVEDAYDQARSIVEKHGGFVASDRVRIAEDEQDTARLTMRLPVEQFESAITDLRQLGEVVRLVGESLDVSQQYYEEGADIRGMADREQWLVDRYERETNERKKRQLKQQIDQLRRELKQEKDILTRLAQQTHWPVLELTLTQSSGPGDFLSRMLGGSVSALAWVGATAIIWVPIVVLLTLFWRRLVPAPPPPE